MKYDLQSQLDKVYATYPEAKRQPIIGITTNRLTLRLRVSRIDLP